MTWIVVTADPSKVRKVRKRLRRKGYAAYLPAIARERAVAKGGKAKRRRVVLPLMSYILVKTPCDSIFDLWLYDVTSTKDVRGYLKSASDKAATVTDANVLELRAKVKWLRFETEARSMKRRLCSGMKARIREGSLAGKLGTVQWVRGAKAGLEAQLFGSMRVVEVKTEQLEAA